MKPIDQIGNTCYIACLASILHCSLNDLLIKPPYENIDDCDTKSFGEAVKKILMYNDELLEKLSNKGYSLIGYGYQHFKTKVKNWNQFKSDLLNYTSLSKDEQERLEKKDKWCRQNCKNEPLVSFPKNTYCILTVDVIPNSRIDHTIVGFCNSDYIVDARHDPNKSARDNGIKYDLDKQCKSIEFIIKNGL